MKHETFSLLAYWLKPQTVLLLLFAFVLFDIGANPRSVEPNTVILSILALTTAWNAFTAKRTRKRLEKETAKQTATLASQNKEINSIKITGQQTHTLSNSAYGEQLLEAVVLRRSIAALSRRLLAISGAEADEAAVAAAEVAIHAAETKYQKHQQQQAIVDMEEKQRVSMNTAIIEAEAKRTSKKLEN